MSKNKRYYHTWLMISFFCIHASCIAQAVKDKPASKKRGEYALVVYTGGGVSHFIGDAGTPATLKAQVYKTNPVGTFRLMWHPDHLLKIGLESGWSTFYSYRIQDNNIKGKVDVRAIPIIIVFSMPVIKRFNVFAGPASYFVTSKLNYEGQATSTALSLGWMAAASYTYPFTNNLGVSWEFKWLNAYETKDASLSLQILLRWKFLKW